MSHFVVWIDGNEARVFSFGAQTFDESTVPSLRYHHVHRHPKDQQTRTHNHPDDEPRFFREVGAALAGEGRILVVGPSVTKLRFLRYAQEHDRALESRIAGIETVDHPTDRQIVAYARDYFELEVARTS
jgi:hypothetical protein